MERGILIAETHHGFVCANAGVDASNVEPGFVTVLPERSRMPRPSACARRSARAFGCPVAVIVSDTFGRAWREGVVNVALGVAGLQPLIDYRGSAGQLRPAADVDGDRAGRRAGRRRGDRHAQERRHAGRHRARRGGVGGRGQRPRCWCATRAAICFAETDRMRKAPYVHPRRLGAADGGDLRADPAPRAVRRARRRAARRRLPACSWR